MLSHAPAEDGTKVIVKTPLGTGELCEELTYHAGLRDGRARTWRLDGTLAREASFSQGEYHGLLRDYDATGTLPDELGDLFSLRDASSNPLESLPLEALASLPRHETACWVIRTLSLRAGVATGGGCTVVQSTCLLSARRYI